MLQDMTLGCSGQEEILQAAVSLTRLSALQLDDVELSTVCTALQWLRSLRTLKITRSFSDDW